MDEKEVLKKLIAVSLLIFFISLVLNWNAYSNMNMKGFSSFSSEIRFDKGVITERITAVPQKNLRTLYRYFKTPILEGNESIGSIIMLDVECKKGVPYYQDIKGNLFIKEAGSFVDATENKGEFRFTEKNEYGCTGRGLTSGNYVFQNGREYWIQGEYKVNPSELVEYNNSYYLNFLVYEKEKHSALTLGKNFKIEGEVIARNFYPENEPVRIFLKVNKEDYPNAMIIKTNYLFNEDSKLIAFLKIKSNYFPLIPLILFLLIWLIFGKERITVNIPDYLSEYPVKRKAWEVAAIYNPDYDGKINKEVLTSLLLDLKQAGAIDLKQKRTTPKIEEQTYFKLLGKKEGLDSVERAFYKLLEELEKHSSAEEIENGYVNLTKAVEKMKKKERHKLILLIKRIEKEINKKSEKFIKKTGRDLYIFLNAIAVAYAYFKAMVGIEGYSKITNIPLIFLAINMILLAYTAKKTALLTRYKKKHYEEYEKWQSFKRFLESDEMLKQHSIEGHIIWGEYLTYAAALGIVEKVLKTMRELEINTKEADEIESVNYSSMAFAYLYSEAAKAESNSKNSGGGFGGGGFLGGSFGGGGFGGR